MPTIRRSVYIGLGGTGIKAIANAKKMYEDIFGEGNIPPQIGFVAIDFDKAIVNDAKLPTRIDEDFITLPSLPICSGVRKKWHRKSVRFLKSMIPLKK